MTEGKLQKKIRRYDYDAILASMDINEAMEHKWITLKDFLEIVEEAKKEFYDLTKGDPKDAFYHINRMRREYPKLLIKWFGDEERGQ